MKKLLVALFVAALVSIASAACAKNLYGADCSCTSDVDGLISSKAITGFTATCNSRHWTIVGSGTFSIGNAAWNINTDRIDLGANLNTTGATLSFGLNKLNASSSGYLNVQGVAKMDGYVNFKMNDWDRTQANVDVKIPFLQYVSNTGAGFVPYSPSLNTQDGYCWKVLPGATVTANTTGIMEVDVSLQKIGGAGCGGPGDRGWVVAFIVILILWGAGLGLFALITCKIDSCYSMWWALK